MKTGDKIHFICRDFLNFNDLLNLAEENQVNLEQKISDIKLELEQKLKLRNLFYQQQIIENYWRKF